MKIETSREWFRSRAPKEEGQEIGAGAGNPARSAKNPDPRRHPRKQHNKMNTIPPHQQRVINEKTELDEKRTKLKAFIDGNAIFAGLPNDEKERLVRQHSCMTEYSQILGERIAAF